MLEVISPEYLAEVRQFAEENGFSEDLEKKLEYLKNYGCKDDPKACKCCIGPPMFKQANSFEFCWYRYNEATGEYDRRWFNGGLIFHGDPKNTNLNSAWGVHT